MYPNYINLNKVVKQNHQKINMETLSSEIFETSSFLYLLSEIVSEVKISETNK